MSLTQELQKSGRQISQGDFTYWEVDNPEDLLNRLILNGYVLHGTSLRVPLLEPRQGNDTFKESGRRNAIYMTDSAPIAMFSAFRGGIPLGVSQHSVNTHINDGKISYENLHFAAQNQHMLADHGYIYIFDRDQYDDHIEGEYLSYKPQKPLAAIRINRTDFKYPIKEIL